MKKFNLLLLWMGLSVAAMAQTARLQVIHNSPEPTVDIWVNGVPFLTDFAFREATAFVDVPAGVALEIGVAPSPSSSPSDIIATFPVTLTDGNTYVAVAHGVLNSPQRPFDLALFDMGQESAPSGQTALLAFHGAPDAQAVDVSVRGAGELFSDLDYAAFQGYQTVPANRYLIDVAPDGGLPIATFEADLSSLGGGAAVVFASGFLANDPAFGLYAALPNGTVVALPAVTDARVQIIHNSPTPTVDIWVNDTPFLTNFAFRTATPFVNVTGNTTLNIGIAPSPSSSPSDIIATFPVYLLPGETYTVIASGVVGDPTTPFDLKVFAGSREAADDAELVDVLVNHGSPDAPAVDIAVRYAGNVIENLPFGEFAGYLSVPAQDVILDIKPAGSSTVVASFRAPLSLLKGGAATVFASGFLGDDPAFGLFATLADGTVLPLEALTTARVQIIHNSPTPTVDIWVNDTPFLTNFAFRTATPFVSVPGNTALNVGIAPSPSTSPSDIIATFPVNFLPGETYTVIASGVVGDPTTPFDLKVFAGSREAAAVSDLADVLVNHGSPDAPAVDIAVRGAGKVITDLAFGEFAGYLSVPAEDVILDIQPAGSSDVVASFVAPLSLLKGAAATVFASGFLGDDPAFGLFAALADGTVLPLEALTTARVQIIHNSPTPTVDIWVNDTPFLTNFAFRTATPFVSVPGNTVLNVGIAPSPSTSPSDIIATFPVNFLPGETYTVIASGVVGDPTTPFDLKVFAGSREAANDTTLVDVLVNHGSPDAPAVDIAVRGAGNVVTDLAFGEFAGYLSVPAEDVTLDIKPAGSPDVVASFVAPLSLLKGGAATVFASGFLGDDPAFGLFAALADGTVLPLAALNTARLQIIHNSPTPTVDIWVNDAPFLTNFAFRTATPFVEVPAGVTLNIGIAPSPSTSPSDIIATFPVTLDANETYTVIASGVVGDPTTPFDLKVFAGSREAADDAELVDVLVNHGSPDAPAVDIAVRGAGKVITDLAFGEFAGYLSVPAEDVILDIQPAGSSDVVASFVAPLSLLKGAAATVFASGFLGDDPAFGLFVALADGTVLPLEALTTARVQIIHNSPTPTVDIWVNDTPFLTNFAFRTATPFVSVPGNTALNVGIAPSPSTSPSDIIATFPVNFLPGETYTVIASGVVGDPTTPFDLKVFAGSREAADDAELVDVLVNHGSPDAPAVDIAVRGGGNIVNDLSFGEFAGYLSVPAADIVLDIKPAGQPDVVASFVAPLSLLKGGAATVFASGFLGDDPAFGLFAALADGTVIPLEAPTTARVQIIHNSPTPTVDIWVNDAPFLTNFAFRTATPFVSVPAGVALNIGIAPSPSTSPSDIIATFPVTFVAGDTYTVIASGVVGDPTTPFDLKVFNASREASNNPELVDVLVNHGSPDAPSVDIAVRGAGNVVTDLAFGAFAGYLSVPANDVILDIQPAGSPTVVASFRAPLSLLKGAAVTVFASGFLGDDPAFGLFAALADGTVLPLEALTTARVQIIHNSPTPTVDIWVNDTPFLTNFAFRTATPFVSVPGNTALNIGIAPSPSTSPSDIIATFPVNFLPGETYVVIASGVVGDPTTPFDLKVFDRGSEASGDPDAVNLLVFHGSPDAPAVDVTTTSGVTLISNIAFGEFQGYATVPAANYALQIKPAGQSTVVATYGADLTTLGGGSAVVFASGFLAGTPGFGLWVALPNGTTFPLSPISSTQNLTFGEMKVFPNPASERLDIRWTSTFSGAMELMVYNGAGQPVLSRSIQVFSGENAATLQLDQLVKGWYLLEMRPANGDAVRTSFLRF